MAWQYDVFLNRVDRRAHRAAIRVTQHHDERCVQKPHPILQTGEPVLVDEIAGYAHHEKIAGALIEGKFGETRESAQLTIAAIGYCALTRAARPAE